MFKRVYTVQTNKENATILKHLAFIEQRIKQSVYKTIAQANIDASKATIN